MKQDKKAPRQAIALSYDGASPPSLTAKGDDELAELHASTKLNSERLFLHHLRDIGRRVAGDWIEANLTCVGEESTVDVRGLFL